MNLGILFSGGKDSYLAMQMAADSHEISCLLTMDSRNQDSWMFHTPAIEWTKLQSESLGIPQIIQETEGIQDEELDDLFELIKDTDSEYWRGEFIIPNTVVPGTFVIPLLLEDLDGADVIVNGYKMGKTPVELSLAANQTYTIEYRKDGYEKIVKIVGTKTGAEWVILDVLAGLVPIIVDAATGDWKKLDTKHINVMLEKEEN